MRQWGSGNGGGGVDENMGDETLKGPCQRHTRWGEMYR